MRPARRDEIRVATNQAYGLARPSMPRVAPDGRRIAWLEERGGTLSIVVRRMSGGPIQQVTATVEPVTDFSWHPDGRSLAYITGKSLRVAKLSGGDRLVTEIVSGVEEPRWSPSGDRLAFVARSRGWSQIFVVPAPHRAAEPLPEGITPLGVDVISYQWHPLGTSISWEAATDARDGNLCQLLVTELAAGGTTSVVAGRDCWATGGRWLPSGDGLIAADDRAGFFHVIHIGADGTRREIDPTRSDDVMASSEPDEVPVPSPNGEAVAFLRYQPGGCSVQIRRIADGSDPVGRGLESFSGTWRSISWLPDGSGVVAVGESESEPADIWILPLRGSPRRITESAPRVLERSVAAPHIVQFAARDGLMITGVLYLPRLTANRRSVPTLVNGHGGPTWQHLRSWDPLLHSMLAAGYAYLSVDFRGSTGYGRDFRHALHGEWGHGDVHDLIDAAHWAATQPWSDGRFGVIGGSYGGYLTLCALVDEPSLWQVGVDRYGDSEIAISYRLGDRDGRLDLERQMGKPEESDRHASYRRGSPLYRTERIEAPLLMLHGRKDRRVVPRMTELMARQLEIEGKFHEVIWFDDEGHGWERRENQRAAAEKTLDFIIKHMPPEVTK